MNESAEFAKKTLEDILSFFGQNLEVSVKLSEDVIELSVPSSSMNGFLIPQNADNLRAMQHLLISILKNAEMELTRVNLTFVISTFDILYFNYFKANIFNKLLFEYF